MDGSGVWMNGLWTPHTNSATSGVFGLSTSANAIPCVSPMLLCWVFVRVETRDLLRDWWKQLWSHHETSRVTMVLVIKVTLNGFAPVCVVLFCVDQM